ncbi:MAG: hypothetical protein WD767_17280 [Alphaproteobacteria bacterium]
MTKGILAVWSDITPDAAADYDRWYEEEHMFERLVVDGFHRARHYRTVSGSQMFFTYFVTDDSRVMKSPAYFESANNSSDWTKRILPHFRNTNRTAFNVVRRIGWGFGAVSMTIRMGAAEGRAGELMRWLGQELFPELLRKPGIIGLQIWERDLDSTVLKVQDASLRGKEDETAPFTVFVEATGMAALESLESGPLSADSLAAHGAEDIIISRHQLMNYGEKEPMAVI